MRKEQSLTSCVLRGVVLLGAIAACGAVCRGAEGGRGDILLLLQKEDLKTYHKVTDLRMYLTEVLNKNALEEISGEGSAVQVIEVGNWAHAPVEVTARRTKMNLRVRDEGDFLVIWYRRSIAQPPGGSALDAIRQVTGEFLADLYVLGQADTLVAPGAQANSKSQIRLIDDAKVVEGTTAIACSYVNVSDERRRWMIVSRVYVLLKDDNVIVVMERSRPRRLGDPYVYEGLRAAKARLTEAEAEQAKGQPVLGMNVVFDAKADVGKLSDAMLNGCMWPLEDQNTVGAKQVCPAIVLRPAEKPVSTPENPPGQP